MDQTATTLFQLVLTGAPVHAHRPPLRGLRAHPPPRGAEFVMGKLIAFGYVGFRYATAFYK